MVEGAVAQRVGQVCKVAVDHGQGQVVPVGIAAGEVGIGRLHLKPRDMQPRHPMRQAEAGHPRAAAKFQRQFTRLCRNGGGEQHRVHRGAVAVLRLKDGQPPVKKAVGGQRVFGKHVSPRWRCRCRAESRGR